MRLDFTDPELGWKSDAQIGNDEAITAYDRALHNRGLMKAPACGGWVPGADGSGSLRLFRDTTGYFRIIWKTVLDLRKNKEG